MKRIKKWWQQKVKPLLLRNVILTGFVIYWIISLSINTLASPERTRPDTHPISQLQSDMTAGKVKKVVINDDNREIQVDLREGKDYLVVYPRDYGDDLMVRLQEAKVPANVVGKGFFEKYQALIGILVLAFVFVCVLLLGGFKLLGKGSLRSSGVAVTPAERPRERFSDVGGADEVIAQLQQAVDALVNPGKYSAFGVKALSGFLLYGDPGTGKTLLARAVAGEANVPFFAVRSSDILGRWLNDGPRGVQAVFAQARKHKASIIFIDEIDSIASKRSSDDGSGSKELNNTLNELLAQIDGFATNSDGSVVLVIGATNRPDDLDPAIKRPGRLTRHLVMPTPDPRAREAILKLHAAKLGAIAPDVDFAHLAKLTSEMTGAQLADLINQAGLLALGQCTDADDKPVATMEHFQEALETAEFGPARKSRVVAEHDRQITAMHESGHAVVAFMLEHAARPDRITIIPRGEAGGYVRTINDTDRMHLSVAQLEAHMATFMAGRAAEKLIFGAKGYTTGAVSDLEVATQVATAMVTQYGMGENCTAQVKLRGEESVFTKEIDALVKAAEALALVTLEQNREKFDALSATLLEVETMNGAEIADLLSV